jgi:hypothetical protein
VARNTVITVALVIASLFLAIALFIAGAVWRGRVTSGNANCSPRPALFDLNAETASAGRCELFGE